MKKIIYFILLILWLIIIFILSNQNGEISGNNSAGIIRNTLDVIYSLFHLSKNNLNDMVQLLQNPIRECAHAFEYFILTFLTFKNLDSIKTKENKYIITLLFCFICASFDEVHQLFISGRTFQYFDIMMDTLGVILMLLIIKIGSGKKSIC